MKKRMTTFLVIIAMCFMFFGCTNVSVSLRVKMQPKKGTLRIS